MNKQIKCKVLALVMLGFTIFSCQDDTTVDNTTAVADTADIIPFKGLPVNHRFKTPLEDLETNHTEGNLKIMYSKAKNSLAKQKGNSYKTAQGELPSPEIIVEATNSVIDEFPYENINNINSGINMAMIENDFPTLTSEEIANNIEIIDDYYSQNLDYVVLSEAAQQQNTQTTSALGNALCTLLKFQNFGNLIAPALTGFIVKTGEFSYIKAVYSLYISQDDATAFAEQEYATTINNKGDAYKHFMWSALQAHNYYTLSSKSPRLRFSEAISYAYEDCSVNIADAREMDYHNNLIGKKLWDDNCGYRRIFGRPVGLNRPEISTLKTKVKALVEAGIFIDRERLGTIESEKIENTRQAIVEANKLQVVFIKQ